MVGASVVVGARTAEREGLICETRPEEPEADKPVSKTAKTRQTAGSTEAQPAPGVRQVSGRLSPFGRFGRPTQLVVHLRRIEHPDSSCPVGRPRNEIDEE